MGSKKLILNPNTGAPIQWSDNLGNHIGAKVYYDKALYIDQGTFLL